MKKLLLSLATASLLFSSCHKDDDDDYVSNTWVFNGTEHNVVNTGRLVGNTNIFVNDGNTTGGYGLTFFFAGAPVSGNYKIVDYPTQPNEVGILAQEGSLLNIYRSTTDGNEGGITTNNISITVEGGHATIYVPSANLTNALPGNGQVSTLTASVRERY